MAKKAMAAGAGVVSPARVLVADEPEIAPTGEEIAKLAYSFWEARGFNGGSPEDDWLRAERELKAKTQSRE